MVIQEAHYTRLTEEATIVARYLLGVTPSDAAIHAYTDGVNTVIEEFTPREQRIWARALEHPWLLQFVDGGLALTDPECATRKRIRLMFAILETEPALAREFIARGGGFWPIVMIFYGLRAVIRSVIGLIVIRVI